VHLVLNHQRSHHIHGSEANNAITSNIEKSDAAVHAFSRASPSYVLGHSLKIVASANAAVYALTVIRGRLQKRLERRDAEKNL